MDLLGADNFMEDTGKVVHLLLHAAALQGVLTLMVAIIPIVVGKIDRFKEVRGNLVHLFRKYHPRKNWVPCLKIP